VSLFKLLEAPPPRQSRQIRSESVGKAEPFRKESGTAAVKGMLQKKELRNLLHRAAALFLSGDWKVSNITETPFYDTGSSRTTSVAFLSSLKP
jgi:hypothetical protein